MCFVFIWEQTGTCATYSINWLVFITQMKNVYSAVQTASLNKAVCASSFKGYSGDMFRLKESSSGKLSNHVWGTSSESTHFWDPKMFTEVREHGYKWSWYLQYCIYIKIYPCVPLQNSQTGDAVKTLKILTINSLCFYWTYSWNINLPLIFLEKK